VLATAGAGALRWRLNTTVGLDWETVVNHEEVAAAALSHFAARTTSGQQPIVRPSGSSICTPSSSLVT
jgi:hypothetical protein